MSILQDYKIRSFAIRWTSCDIIWLTQMDRTSAKMNYLYLFYKDIQLTNCGLVSPATFQQGLQKVRSTCEIDFWYVPLESHRPVAPLFPPWEPSEEKEGIKSDQCWILLHLGSCSHRRRNGCRPGGEEINPSYTPFPPRCPLSTFFSFYDFVTL